MAGPVLRLPGCSELVPVIPLVALLCECSTCLYPVAVGVQGIEEGEDMYWWEE